MGPCSRAGKVCHDRWPSDQGVLIKWHGELHCVGRSHQQDLGATGWPEIGELEIPGISVNTSAMAENVDSVAAICHTSATDDKWYVSYTQDPTMTQTARCLSSKGSASTTHHFSVGWKSSHTLLREVKWSFWQLSMGPPVCWSGVSLVT